MDEGGRSHCHVAVLPGSWFSAPHFGRKMGNVDAISITKLYSKHVRTHLCFVKYELFIRLTHLKVIWQAWTFVSCQSEIIHFLKLRLLFGPNPNKVKEIMNKIWKGKIRNPWQVSMKSVNPKDASLAVQFCFSKRRSEAKYFVFSLNRLYHPFWIKLLDLEKKMQVKEMNAWRYFRICLWRFLGEATVLILSYRLRQLWTTLKQVRIQQKVSIILGGSNFV